MKKKENLKINDDHIVTLPKLHDGMLKKIEILDDDNFKILIKTTNKTAYSIIFHNVEYLIVNNFEFGNIILDVEIWQNCNCSVKFLKKILGKDQNSEYFIQLSKKIKLGELSFIMINPSYGAELICICESFECYSNL